MTTRALRCLAEFGNLDVMAAAVIQFESQRLGLEDDNDSVYYTFSAGYNLKPHRFQFDVVYYRDRFLGADLATPRAAASGTLGYQGQKTDSVLLMASWSGQVGPVRALFQANGVVGRAKGGTAGLPNFPTTVSQRGYDILAGAAAAYAEVDVGIVKPFVAFVLGTPDSNPNDRELHGFSGSPWGTCRRLRGSRGLRTSIPVRIFLHGIMRVRRGCRGCGMRPPPRIRRRLERGSSGQEPVIRQARHRTSVSMPTIKPLILG